MGPVAVAPLDPPPIVAPDRRPWGFAVGAAIDALSFAVGVALLGTDAAGFDQARAGWMTCSFGFALGPFVGHAITGQWLRGALFSVVPVAAAVGNAIVLLPPTETIDQTPLINDQRFIWAFTSIGLAGSVAGLIDVALAKPSPVRITPAVSKDGASLFVGGRF